MGKSHVMMSEKEVREIFASRYSNRLENAVAKGTLVIRFNSLEGAYGRNAG